MRQLLTAILLFSLVINSQGQSWDWSIGLHGKEKNWYDHHKWFAGLDGSTYLLTQGDFDATLPGAPGKTALTGFVKFNADGSIAVRNSFSTDSLYSILTPVQNPTNQDIYIPGIFYKTTRFGHFTAQSVEGKIQKFLLLISGKDANWKGYREIFEYHSKRGTKSSITKMQVDKDGNFYFSGAIDDTIFFRNNGMIPFNKNPKSSTYGEPVVFKTDSLGNLQWYRIFPNPSGSYPYGNTKADHLNFDGEGNIVFSVLSINPGIWKFNSAGQRLDSALFSAWGINNRFYIYDLVSLPNGEIWIAGGGSNVDYTRLTVQGKGFLKKPKKPSTNTAIICFDKNLDLLNSHVFTHLHENNWLQFSFGEMLPDKEGNVYFTGNNRASMHSATDTIFLDDKPVLNGNDPCFFVCRLNNKKQPDWLYKHIYPSYLTQSIEQVFLDECNNAYFSGTFDPCYGRSCDSIVYDIQFGGNVLNNKNYYGYFFSKLNPDTLDFVAEPDCNGASLVNLSNGAYKSFLWELPDGSSFSSKNTGLSSQYKDSLYVRLTGLKTNGCSNVIIKKIKYKTAKPPVAYFTADRTTGCQWVKTSFRDSSFADTINPRTGASWLWNFGDGTTDNNQNPVHSYTKSGEYKVKLIYSNGFCSDTFIMPGAVTVMPAAKPGMLLSQTTGCAPLGIQVRSKTEGDVSGYFYDFDNGQSSTDSSPFVSFEIPGEYMIRQTVVSPSGCKTFDSAKVTVYAGMKTGQHPELLSVSVTDSNTVSIHWNGIAGMAGYKLMRSEDGLQFEQLSNTKETVYEDKNVHPALLSYTYSLSAFDQCNSESENSLFHSTMLLRGNSHTGNDNTLTWTPYTGWQSGVKNYIVEKKKDGRFTPVASLEGNVNTYSDPNDASEENDVCYRIKAVENGGAKQESYSNTLCLDHTATLWVPNAFSPNADGVNDVLTIKSRSLAQYKISIYNRWGMLVYESTEQDKAWDGRLNGAYCPAGIYVYKIIAKSVAGQTIFRKGTVEITP